jgi:hypothetical protein
MMDLWPALAARVGRRTAALAGGRPRRFLTGPDSYLRHLLAG